MRIVYILSVLFRTIQDICIWYVKLLILFLAIDYMSLLFLPHTFWFNYDSVEYKQYNDGIVFQSVLNNKRSGDMHRSDILRCDMWFWYKYYSVYLSEWVTKPWPRIANWRYWWEYPTEWTCYLESNIKIQLRYWITKAQKIYSQPFILWSTND